MTIQEKLTNIQSKLKAPKGQYNSFGKYNYRSCEDILEGLKPLLEELKASVTVSDELVLVGDRYYIKATAKLIDSESEISTTAYAREEETKKGMDGAQVTGSASSYARKYALNGLFAIDDTKDADTMDKHESEPKSETSTPPPTNGISEKQEKRLFAIANSKGFNTESVRTSIFKKFSTDISQLTKAQYDAVCKGYESLEDKK